jgi:hypothetical protein
MSITDACTTGCPFGALNSAPNTCPHEIVHVNACEPTPTARHGTYWFFGQYRDWERAYATPIHGNTNYLVVVGTVLRLTSNLLN